MPVKLKHPAKDAANLTRLEAAALIADECEQPDEAERLRTRARYYRARLDAAERCRHCGRKIEDPLSVARGIGSTCWASGAR